MIHLIYFSPTGGSKKYLQTFRTRQRQLKYWDLTYKDPGEIHLKEDELLIIAFPVYYGRLPLLFLQRLEGLWGSGTPAILLAVYGNRAYDDAFFEMKEFLLERAFVPYAGGALVAKHSYGPIQSHRPDGKDLKELEEFFHKAVTKEKEAKNYDFPGSFPLREGGKTNFFPSTREDCIRCRACIRACPASAIDESIQTIKKSCISCMACLEVCPVDARVLDEEFHLFIKDFSEKLKEPKKNIFFL